MGIKAPAYLQSSPLSHVNMLAVLRRGTAEVVEESNQGALLYEKISHAYMISAADIQSAQRLIEHVENHS